jgi:hypothetical protein
MPPAARLAVLQVLLAAAAAAAPLPALAVPPEPLLAAGPGLARAVYARILAQRAHLQAAAAAGPAPLNNVGFLAVGYDLVQANPEAADGIDPGFRNYVFQLSYDQGLTTPDGRFRLPDNTTALMQQACSYTSTTFQQVSRFAEPFLSFFVRSRLTLQCPPVSMSISCRYQGQTSYSSSLTVAASLSGNIAEKFKFTASADYKAAATATSSGSTTVVQSKAFCSR